MSAVATASAAALPATPQSEVAVPSGRIALLTEQALCWEHGTGAQLLRLFDRPGMDFFHLYFWREGYGASAHEESYLLQDPVWPYSRGGGLSQRVRRLLGLTWWDAAGRVNPKQFAALGRRANLRCDLAYVVIGSEGSARHANSMLEELGSPAYIVHIMDIYEDGGLDPSAMPAMRKLLEGAASVIALTPTIREEVARFSLRDLVQIPIGQELTPHIAHAPMPAQPVRCVMVGRPYPEGGNTLAAALPLLAERTAAGTLPPIEFVNLGSHFGRLPKAVQQVTQDLGQVNDREKYARTLADCHIAFLSGPSALDHFGRFSFPSRSSDYFMAGLPTVGCIAAGTATERMLAPLAPDAVRIARTPEALAEALAAFATGGTTWEAASRRVRRFAEEELAIDVVRRRVYETIARASKRVARGAAV